MQCILGKTYDFQWEKIDENQEQLCSGLGENGLFFMGSTEQRDVCLWKARLGSAAPALCIHTELNELSSFSSLYHRNFTEGSLVLFIVLRQFWDTKQCLSEAGWGSWGLSAQTATRWMLSPGTQGCAWAHGADPSWMYLWGDLFAMSDNTPLCFLVVIIE